MLPAAATAGGAIDAGDEGASSETASDAADAVASTGGAVAGTSTVVGGLTGGAAAVGAVGVGETTCATATGGAIPAGGAGSADPSDGAPVAASGVAPIMAERMCVIAGGDDALVGRVCAAAGGPWLAAVLAARPVGAGNFEAIVADPVGAGNFELIVADRVCANAGAWLVSAAAGLSTLAVPLLAVALAFGAACGSVTGKIPRSAAATSPSAATGATTGIAARAGAGAAATGGAEACAATTLGDGGGRGSADLNSQTMWFRRPSSIVSSSIFPDLPFTLMSVSPGLISRPGLLTFHDAAKVPNEIFSTIRILFLSSI